MTVTPLPARQVDTLNLLSCNILAGARVQHYHEYVTRSWASVLPTRRKLDNLDHLARLFEPFDVIGLQEADAGSLRSGFRNQTRYLAEAADMPYWSFQPNRPMGGLAHTANGLLSRMQPNQVLDYPLPGRIPGRGVMLACFDHHGDTLAVAIAHLSLGAQGRMRQLDFIGELLSDYPHAVLMGDLNTGADSPEMQRLFRRTRLTPPRQPMPTFPSWRPQRALDHILVSDGLRIERVWTLHTGGSDHLPLAAAIRLPEAGSHAQPVRRRSA
ncbi:MAG TPA: endonuclease/exonuclease/phosphatase family protein [Rhodanobacteraceae bacterium]